MNGVVIGCAMVCAFDCIAYVPCGSQGRAPRLIYKGTGQGHGNLVGLRFCVEAGLGATLLRASARIRVSPGVMRLGVAWTGKAEGLALS